MKPLHAVALTYLYGSGLLCVLTGVVVLYRYPDNHVGWDPAVLWAVPVLTVGMLAAPWLERRVWSWFFPLFWIATVALLWAMDGLNLLLPYEEWIRRGMPRPGI